MAGPAAYRHPDHPVRALVVLGSCRRRGDGTTARVPCLRSSRRHAVAAMSSAAGGPSVSKAVTSTRCRQRDPLAGAAAGDHVTVTDSHHPALRTAPACSWRRQCPRATCTRSSQRPWSARCAGMTLRPRMLTIMSLVSSSGIIATAARLRAARPQDWKGPPCGAFQGFRKGSCADTFRDAAGQPEDS